MTFAQEFASWRSPTKLELADAPSIGSKAPSTPQLSFPRNDQKAAIVLFLRHCGCPFAEKAFVSFRKVAERHPAITFLAISHSSDEHTSKWLSQVGGAGNVQVLVDSQRSVFSAWGLGASSFWHVLNPYSLTRVIQLGRQDGIWNRPTESGSRWQRSGWWAVDGGGIVRWGKASDTADEIGNWEEGVATVK